MEVEKMSFPKDWKWVKLRELGTWKGGGTPSKSRKDFWEGGSIPWVSPKDMKSMRIVDTIDKITPAAIEGSSVNLIPKGSVLFVVRSGILRRTLPIALTTNEATVNQDMQAFTPKDVLPEYVYWFAASANDAIRSACSKDGTTVESIDTTSLKDYEIPVCSFEEQQRIVAKIEEFFSELDAGKGALEKAAQQLKVYRQAVLKWAFEGRLTSDVVDGELPDGWKLVKLGDACKGVEYGSAAKSDKSGKVPVLRMGNIQGGRFDYSDLVYTSDEAEIKKYLLKKDDVLFNRTNSAELVGKTAIYKGERPAIFAGYLIRIHRDESLLDANYLTYYLNTETARAYGNTVRSFGVNQSNINGTKLKTYPLPLPPLEEQNRIVQEIEARLSVCDKIEGTIAESLQQAEALRQSILKKAFEGKLV